MPVSFVRGLRAALVAAGIVALAAAGPAVAQGSRPAPDPAAAEAAYEAARALLDARLYAPAARAFGGFRDAYPAHPRLPEALFHEAEAALSAGDSEGAGVLFADFRARYPAHPLAGRAAVAVGERAFAEGDDARAEAALREGLEGPTPLPDMDAARAQYLLGLAVARQGRTDEALAEFDAVAATYPDTPSAPAALYAAGAARAVGGDWDGAAAAFEQLEQGYPAAPENAAVGPALGEAYARQGRFDEAARALARRRPSLTGDAAARGDLLLGDALLRTGDRDGARAALERVPDGSPYARRARFAQGRLAYDERRWADAAAYFAEVRTGRAEGGGVDALAHEATYLEGLALKQTGDLTEAEARFTEAAAQSDGAWAAPALLEQGLLRFERRRYAEAAGSFERVLDDHPRSPVAGEAARLLGEAYTALGDNARAREAVRRAEGLGVVAPDLRAEVDFQQALARLNTDPQGSADAFQAVYRADPNGPRAGEALFWAGEAAFQAGLYARAEGHFNDLLRLFPNHRQALPARYALAWTHFRRRDWAAAATGFEAFLAAYRPDNAEAVPYLADALLRLGDSYFALRRFDAAEAAYGRARTAAPAGQGADYALYQTAQAQAEAGRPEQALATLDQLLAEYPRSTLRPDALYARGYVRFNTGDFDGAIAEYQRVLDEHAASATAAKALYAIGDAHFNAGRTREAEAAYRGVLERYPQSPFVANALEGLDVALSEQGRRSEFAAAAAAAEARVSDPAARDRLRLRRAELDVAAGDFAAAEPVLNALIEGAGDRDVRARALHAYGAALVGQGRPGEAAEAYDWVVREYAGHPLQADAAVRRGEALLADGQAERAAQVMADFERLFPDDAELVAAALWVQSRALAEAGRAAEAEAARARLLDRFPDSAAAADARAAGGE